VKLEWGGSSRAISEKGMQEFVVTELASDLGGFHSFLCMTHDQFMELLTYVEPTIRNALLAPLWLFQQYRTGENISSCNIPFPGNCNTPSHKATSRMPRLAYPGWRKFQRISFCLYTSSNLTPCWQVTSLLASFTLLLAVWYRVVVSVSTSRSPVV